MSYDSVVKDLMTRMRRVAWKYGVLTVFLLHSPAAQSQQVLLFPFFDGNGQGGVYLAWSNDGRVFHAINDGRPIFRPPQWKDQNLTRDPSITYEDGLFHMVWTSHWNGQVFGYASSPDLRSWSEPQKVQPFPDSAEQPRNVWAPELLRDHLANDFKIMWSSTMPSELDDGDGSEDSHGYDHRIYFVSTSNFQKYNKPALLFNDEDYSVIDAHVVYNQSSTENPVDGRWLMTLKKEVSTERGGKNIRFATSPPSITPGSFGSITQPVVGAGTDIQGAAFAEGPSLVKWKGEWLLYWDSYTAGHYSMASSTDFKTWKDETSLLRLPVPHPRHGTVFIADGKKVGWTIDKDHGSK